MAWVYDFDSPPDAPAAELNRLLGGKGANLVVMARDLGMPVPPGFVITTEACRAYLRGTWPEGLDDEVRAAMARLGGRVGRQFGDPSDPLLVSVRSGAPVSMPGMMDTLLDLGVTDSTVSGLAHSSGSTDFADDCRRRLAEGWRAVIGDGVVPEDPWAQLRKAVEAVFRSWNSERAKAYRQREGIAHDLGTAVTVQAMVFGNRGADSGTGVLFTRNPSTGERKPFGDLMFDAQGEDVVAGTHATQPVAALEARLPEVAAQLRGHAQVLERYYRDLCDIEFTIEDGRLWMLQVRVGKRSPQAALRMAVEMAEDPDFPLSREEAVRRVLGLLSDVPRVFVATADTPAPITTGLPASPGVAGGAVVTSSAAAETANGPVILVRAETSPEDVPGMAKSAGVLTARGGLASHAAVVARGWGIPAVVGAAEVTVGESEVVIAGRRFAPGSQISIDGSSGAVYAGLLEGRWEVAPESETLLRWARDLGISIQDADKTAAAKAEASLVTDDVVRTLAIKGTAPIDVEAGSLVETTSDGVRLTAEGKEAAAALFATDAASLGEERGLVLVREFHELDLRMKDVVTAWQLREVDGAQTLNDHADAAYDAKVLGDLAALHSDAAGWLEQLVSIGRRFSAYRDRLANALEMARADQRYVASPRVDSYHTVWFELHEDLIRTTGRTRADEASAGRA